MTEIPPAPAMHDASTVTSFVAERRRSDRRHCATPFISRFTFAGGNREGARREGEDKSIFVDRYSQLLFLVGTMILLLNMLDAWFTVLLLGIGGEEVNPIANLMLASGTVTFLLVKTVGIGLCTAILVMIKNFRGAKLGLSIVAGAYSLLLAWHLYLAAYMGLIL